MPKITILLPTYQSGKYLSQTLDSIRNQTMKDYEILVVDDKSTDNTLSILREAKDLPIRIIVGNCSGLADALNIGIIHSRGEYIARIDADDLMVPDRLEKQTKFLDVHSNIIVCGGWQQYFGKNFYLHKPPSDPKQCRTNLIFRCDLCHSTLMLRKNVFIKERLFYDGAYAAEDFELWTRVLDYGDVANIPEILGYYRFDNQNITKDKMKLLIEQNGKITAKTLKHNLNIDLNEQQIAYFSGWNNPFFEDLRFSNECIRKKAFEDLKLLFLKIDKANKQIGAYDQEALRKTLQAEWMRLRYGIGFYIMQGEIDENNLFKEFSLYRRFFLKIKSIFYCYPGLKSKIIKLAYIIKNKMKRVKK